jgi:uncharacterized Zn finger protein
MSRYYEEWAPYVSVAERQAKAAREVAKLRKKGQAVEPVVLTGRHIATTFWGKSWCENLASYRDMDNRLERGRSYVRSGAVLDLQLAPQTINALVSGSSIYKVNIGIKAIPGPHWQSICRDCAGGIDSLVELLRGRFSKPVMERLCRQEMGLFPSPGQIKFSCNCYDFATMCKHVAAVLYAVGARLDEKPELLFRLRGVDQNELLANLESDPLAGRAPPQKILDSGDLSALFGLEMGESAAPPAAVAAVAPKPKPKAKTPAKRVLKPGKAVKAASAKPVAKKRSKAAVNAAA